MIGQIGRAHGIHGELRAYPTGPTLANAAAGTVIRARADDGACVELTLDELRATADALIVRFRGVTSREAAGAVVGRVLEVPVGALPDLPDEDEFYVRDLIGCRVVLAPSERPLGSVTQVHSGAANDALEVRAEDDRTVLIPFTHDAIVRFDRQQGAMWVREDLLGGADA